MPEPNPGAALYAAECVRTTSDIEPEPMPKRIEGPAVWDLVKADIDKRDQIGTAKYGQRLTPADGRRSLVDAYQEALDLVVYLKKEIVESDALKAQVAELARERDEVRVNNGADDRQRLAGLFDRYGIACGNCGAQIIARGGSLGEHHGLTGTEGEEEALCGHCAGLELTTLRVRVAGMKREWSTYTTHDTGETYRQSYLDEASAREAVKTLTGFGRVKSIRAESRLVSPWEPEK